MDILRDGIIQLAYFVSIIFILGIFISATSKQSQKNIYESFGMTGIIATGIIGTTIHELSHLTIAIIFRHKVNEVKLFILKPKDETLGYIRHAYDTTSLYRNIGNFFIGIAPLLGGTLIITILIKVLIPESFSVINESLLNTDINLNILMIINNSINFGKSTPTSKLILGGW